MNTSAKWLSLYQSFLKNITCQNVQAEQVLFSVANNCDKGLHGIFSHYWFIAWLGDRFKRVNSTQVTEYQPAIWEFTLLEVEDICSFIPKTQASEFGKTTSKIYLLLRSLPLRLEKCLSSEGNLRKADIPYGVHLSILCFIQSVPWRVLEMSISDFETKKPICFMVWMGGWVVIFYPSIFFIFK